MSKRLFYATALIAWLSLTPLQAQEGRGKGRLIGEVKDDGGLPLAGVELTLKSLQFDFQLTTISDEKGRFGFTGFAGGSKPNFDLSAQKEGYTPILLRLQLSGLKANPLQKIVMKKVATLEKGNVDPQAVSETDLALIKKAEALQKAGQYDQAANLYRQFLSTNPIHHRYQVNLGNCLSELKDYPGAIAAFEAALEGMKQERADGLKGNSLAANLYTSIGTSWLNQGDNGKAAEYYKKSAQLTPPTDPALAYNLAELLMAGNDTTGAIEYYTLAIQLNPKDPLYHEKIGYAHLNAGDIPKARDAFNGFLKLAPNHPRAAEVADLLKSLQ